MDTKITPLPWEAFTEERFSGWYAIREKDGGEVGSGDGGFTEEDAAFIVKAVNTHDALIAAAKRASAAIGNLGHAEGGLSGRDELDKASDDLDAAIAAAEGK